MDRVSMGKLKTDNSLILPIMATAVVTACNLPGSALLSVFGTIITAGTLFFPLALILFDLNTYFYGAKSTQKALFYIVISQILVFIITGLISLIAQTDTYVMSLRVIAGSIIAFFISSNMDVKVFTHLNNKFSRKKLWLSVNASNFISQFIDTAIFSFIVFIGVLLLADVIQSGLLIFTIKMLSSIVLTPCLYLIKHLITLKRK
jgi:uncharacterized integral membrane protein (TIGR00697 family)